MVHRSSDVSATAKPSSSHASRSGSSDSFLLCAALGLADFALPCGAAGSGASSWAIDFAFRLEGFFVPAFCKTESAFARFGGSAGRHSLTRFGKALGFSGVRSSSWRSGRFSGVSSSSSSSSKTQPGISHCCPLLAKIVCQQGSLEHALHNVANSLHQPPSVSLQNGSLDDILPSNEPYCIILHHSAPVAILWDTLSIYYNIVQYITVYILKKYEKYEKINMSKHISAEIPSAELWPFPWRSATCLTQWGLQARPFRAGGLSKVDSFHHL